MKYTLTKKSDVLLGPIEWNVIKFNDVLLLNDINVSLSINAPIKLSYINEDYKIWPTKVIDAIPSVTQRVQYELSFDDEYAYYTAKLIDLTSDEIKDLAEENRKVLISNLSQNRKKLQYNFILMKINDINYSFDGSESGQNAIYNTWASLTDTDVINWKLSTGDFITINKEILKNIISFINDRTQKLFTKQMNYIELINSTSDIDILNNNISITWE